MYFFVRTQNPRPTFHLDITPEEREIMDRHIAYWTGKAQAGIAVVFGPVMDPKGVYGMGVYRVQDEQEMQDMLANDPAKELLQYEFFPCHVQSSVLCTKQADSPDPKSHSRPEA